MWIESHQTLARHPKVIRLAARLGVSKPAAIGHLHLLWWWCLDFARDGNLSMFSADEVSAASEWPGDPELFLGSLKACALIEDDGMVHDWYQYAGRLIDKRAADAERKKALRGASIGHPSDIHRTSIGRPSDVHRTSSGHPLDGARNSNGRRSDGARTAQVPNLTIPNREDTHSVARAQEPEQKTETPAVELPPGFPKTEEQAVDRCFTLGVPPDFIRSTWLRASGRGGRDARDVPIRNFPSHVQSCWGYEQSRKAERANGEPGRGQGEAGSSVAIIRDQKALERVEKAIADLKASAGSDAFGPMYSEGDRKRLKELKASRKELLARLGMVA